MPLLPLRRLEQQKYSHAKPTPESPTLWRGQTGQTGQTGPTWQKIIDISAEIICYMSNSWI